MVIWEMVYDCFAHITVVPNPRPLAAMVKVRGVKVQIRGVRSSCFEGRP